MTAEHPAERRRRIKAQVFATPADAAFVLGCDKKTINRWVTSGKVDEYLLDGQRFVRLSEVSQHSAGNTK